MGYNAKNTTNPYGIRLVQKGYPRSVRTGSFSIERHGVSAGDGDADWLSSLFIDYNGNVGVGNTTPNARLDVVNNFAAGTGGSALIVNANGNGSSSGTTIFGAQINAATAVGTGSTQTVYGVDISATALGTGPSPLTAVNAKTVLSRLGGATVYMQKKRTYPKN